MRLHDQRAERDVAEGIPIGPGVDGGLCSRKSTRAGDVFDDNRLIEFLFERTGQHTGLNVRGTARAIGADEGDGLFGVFRPA